MRHQIEGRYRKAWLTNFLEMTIKAAPVALLACCCRLFTFIINLRRLCMQTAGTCRDFSWKHNIRMIENMCFSSSDSPQISLKWVSYSEGSLHPERAGKHFFSHSPAAMQVLLVLSACLLKHLYLRFMPPVIQKESELLYDTEIVKNRVAHFLDFPSPIVEHLNKR